MRNVHLPTLAFYAGLAIVAVITLVRFALPSSSGFEPRVAQAVFIVIGLAIMAHRIGVANAKKQD